jgi:hypothetical protein
MPNIDWSIGAGAVLLAFFVVRYLYSKLMRSRLAHQTSLPVWDQASQHVPSRSSVTERDEVIPVESVSDEYAYLSQNFCACGGSWDVVQRSSEHIPLLHALDHFSVKCSRCGSHRSLTFSVDTRSSSYRAGVMAIGALTQPIGDDDRERLLREALTLDPGNEIALTELGRLQARRKKKI